MKKLAVLCLAAMSLGACADRVDPLGVSPAEAPLLSASTSSLGVLTRITSAGDAANPAISGSRIVWTATGRCHPMQLICEIDQGDIYLLDAVTGESANHLATVALNPAISGNRIVWQQFNPSGVGAMFDINLHRISNGSTTTIGTGAFPSISGDYIAYFSDWGSVRWYNHATGTDGQVGSGHGQLAISGNRIVYSDFGNHIQLVEVPSGAPTQLSTTRGHNLAISGDRVVWLENSHGPGAPGNLILHDITSRSQRTLDVGLVQAPAISGNRIVYVQNGEVWMYDIATDQATQISTGSAATPAISGHRIVWTDSGDVYLFEFNLSSDERVTAISSAVGDFLTSGDIGNAGVAESLNALASQTLAALARDNERAAVNTLNAMIRYVNAQSGKQISPSAAADLIQMAEGAIASL